MDTLVALSTLHQTCSNRQCLFRDKHNSHVLPSASSVNNQILLAFYLIRYGPASPRKARVFFCFFFRFLLTRNTVFFICRSFWLTPVPVVPLLLSSLRFYFFDACKYRLKLVENKYYYYYHSFYDIINDSSCYNS